MNTAHTSGTSRNFLPGPVMLECAVVPDPFLVVVVTGSLYPGNHLFSTAKDAACVKGCGTPL